MRFEDDFRLGTTTDRSIPLIQEVEDANTDLDRDLLNKVESKRSHHWWIVLCDTVWSSLPDTRRPDHRGDEWRLCFFPHTRFTGTAGRVHCVRIFTHFPCYEPACWSLNFMHFQTSVIRLVDRLTWFYRFGITLQINLSPKVCDLSVMFWINIYKLGLKKYPLKSRNFGNLVCLYLGYHGNYTRFICF